MLKTGIYQAITCFMYEGQKLFGQPERGSVKKVKIDATFDNSFVLNALLKMSLTVVDCVQNIYDLNIFKINHPAYYKSKLSILYE